VAKQPNFNRGTFRLIHTTKSRCNCFARGCG